MFCPYDTLIPVNHPLGIDSTGRVQHSRQRWLCYKAEPDTCINAIIVSPTTVQEHDIFAIIMTRGI